MTELPAQTGREPMSAMRFAPVPSALQTKMPWKGTAKTICFPSGLSCAYWYEYASATGLISVV